MLGLGVGSNSGLATESSVMPRGGGYTNEYSAYFDGTGDYFDTRDQTDSTFQTSFTIAMWFWPADGHGSQTLFGARSVDANNLIWLYLTTAGQLAIYHISNGDACLAASPADTFIADSQPSWTHVALAVTKVPGGNTTYQFYVDGEPVTTDLLSFYIQISDTNHALFSMDRNFFIGGHNLGALNTPATGFIDEVAVFGAAFNDDIAEAVYNGGTSFDLTAPNGDNYTSVQVDKLRLYYRFENSSDDLGSIGSDGAVAGDTIYSTLLTPP